MHMITVATIAMQDIDARYANLYSEKEIGAGIWGRSVMT